PRGPGRGLLRVARARRLVAVACARATPAGVRGQGPGGPGRGSGLRSTRRLCTPDRAHRADDRGGRRGPPAAPPHGGLRLAGPGRHRGTGRGSAGGTGRRILAELRWRCVAGLVPARRGPATGARPAGRPGRRQRRAVALDRRAVQPGLAGRPVGEPGRDPLVEPGGGAPVAAGYRGGNAGTRARGVGLARGRAMLRRDLAAVRVDGGEPVGPVVAAGAALARGPPGPGRRVLAAVAPGPAGQGPGAAAVAAIAVAGSPPAAAWRGGAAPARCRARTGGTGPYRRARLALRRRSGGAGGL